MIRHIVLWRLKEAAHGQNKADNALQIKAKLEAMRGQIPGLLTLEVGIDELHTPSSSDIALICTFTDHAALDAYQAHPVHLEIMPFIMEARAERRVVDFEVNA